MSDFLNVSGAIASWIGAVIAIVQTRRAIASAKESSRIKIELQGRVKAAAVSNLHFTMTRLQEASRELSVSTDSRQTRGGKLQKTREDMQRCLDDLRANLHHLAAGSEARQLELERQFRRLQETFDALGSCQEIEKRTKLQQEVHRRVGEFVATISREKDASYLPDR